MKARKIKNLYKLEGSTEINEESMVFEEENKSARSWNQLLGHMNEKEINVLMNCKLLPYLKYLNLNFHMHCVFGKHNRQKFKTSSHISKGILEYIRSDIWGPSSTI